MKPEMYITCIQRLEFSLLVPNSCSIPESGINMANSSHYILHIFLVQSAQKNMSVEVLYSCVFQKWVVDLSEDA